MLLNIIKPTQKKSIEIQWLDIETPVGSFVIQDGHAPMIVTLKKNTDITYKLINNIQETIKVVHGIAHINRKIVTVLLNK